jgi:hypothetical protein
VTNDILFKEQEMKLLTKAIKAKLPKLYSTDEQGEEAVAQVKFFDPTGSWTWFATEAAAVTHENGETIYSQVGKVDNPEDVIFFGLVSGFELELGYFSLSELQSVRGRLGLGIERDRHWTPKTLRECRLEAARGY